MSRKLRIISDWLGVSNSFALANILAFATSGSPVGLTLAILTAVLSWRAGNYAAGGNLPVREQRMFSWIQLKVLGTDGQSQNLALRINAWGIAVAAVFTGGVAFLTGGFDKALFPVLAGLSFAVGNYLGSSPHVTSIQKGERQATGLTRALTNPAVYYGLGYTNLGLLAGGGLALFFHPLSNVPALMTTALSIIFTLTSISGLMADKLKNPAPFMFVAHGTALNVLSAILTGNILSALNNLCACHGEVKLGMILREKEPLDADKLVKNDEMTASATAELQALSRIQRSSGLVDRYYSGLSHVACWPVRAIDRHKHL